MDGACSAHGDMRNAYRFLGGKLKGKRPRGRTRRRREIILKRILWRQGERVHIGFIWLRIRANGRLLKTRQ